MQIEFFVAFSCVSGEVLERLNRPVSKTGVPLRVPRVQIPPSPPELENRVVSRF